MEKKYSVILLPENGEDAGTFLNSALREVSSEFVWIRSEKAAVDEETVSGKMLALFRNSEVAAVYSSQRPETRKAGISEAFQASFFPQRERIHKKSDILSCGMETFFLSNTSCMYRTADLISAGGFPAKELSFSEHITGANLIHAGKKIVYIAEAEVTYLHRLTPLLALHEGFDYGVMEKRNIQAFGLYVIDDGSYGVIQRSLTKIYRDAYRSARAWLRRRGAVLKIPGAWLCYLGLKYGNILGRRYHRLPAKINRVLCSKKDYFV